MRKPVIGVMGGGETASDREMQWAHELGAAIASRDWVLLTGGRPVGVMNAASKGAKENGGFVVGIILTEDASSASDAVDLAIVTGMGSARNNINALSSDVVVACGTTTPGTLSEIALALKANKPVVLLSTDPEATAFLTKVGNGLLQVADTPEMVVEIVSATLEQVELNLIQ